MTEISKEQFLAQRCPRRGRSNPERMDLPVWHWLVRNGMNAFFANEHFACPGPFDEGWSGPGWCFDRMGCPRVQLADGRRVSIAGEHEDGYDPDFYIYNDVVVEHPDGEVQIFGYPEAVFPPTDFHSATLDTRRNSIWVVGNLGHEEQARPGETPVFRLCLESFAMQEVPTGGQLPGWIHKHGAVLLRDGAALQISRGCRRHEGGEVLDQCDDWELDLETLQWRRLTERSFRQWRIRAAEGRRFRLAEMMMLDLEAGMVGSGMPSIYELMKEQLQDGCDDEEIQNMMLGAMAADRAEAAAHFDPELHRSLFAPPLDFVVEEQELADEEDSEDWADNMCHDHRRIRVEDCLVRYTVGSKAVEVKLEGMIDPQQEQVIVRDLASKLGRIHGMECPVERLSSP